EPRRLRSAGKIFNPESAGKPHGRGRVVGDSGRSVAACAATARWKYQARLAGIGQNRYLRPGCASPLLEKTEYGHSFSFLGRGTAAAMGLNSPQSAGAGWMHQMFPGCSRAMPTSQMFPPVPRGTQLATRAGALVPPGSSSSRTDKPGSRGLLSRTPQPSVFTTRV